jgi:hypothetical protein
MRTASGLSPADHDHTSVRSEKAQRATKTDLIKNCMRGATKNSNLEPSCHGGCFWAVRLSHEDKHMKKMIGERLTSRPRNPNTMFISVRDSGPQPL